MILGALTRLRWFLAGRRLRKSIERNTLAAEQLDAAVREVMSK